MVSKPGSLIDGPADRQLDVRGKVCPYPTVEAVKALDQLEAGAILEVVTDYPPARTTLPFLFWKRHYSWAIIPGEGAQFRVRVRKEEVPDPPAPPGLR